MVGWGAEEEDVGVEEESVVKGVESWNLEVLMIDEVRRELYL